jgi:hypothetical protein
VKAFECDQCGNLVFFENVTCLRCNSTLGFLPEFIDLSALEPAAEGAWKPLSRAAANTVYRQCQNAIQYQICNWLIPHDDPNPLCRSCRLNLVIPDLGIPQNLALWHKLELAKRRVMYSILRLKLPAETEEGKLPLRFKFMSDPSGGPALLTGHARGVITINIAEADDAEREKRRVELHEPLRTLLGHVRHEIAHYYWDRLILNSPWIDQFRRIFGDERQDYSECLRKHYQQGPPADWQTRFLSMYSACHPWEDWAETWAHYLHMIDSLETAGSFGLSLRPRHAQAETMRADPNKVAYNLSDFDEIIRHWLPLTHALNELNRGMGLPDLYPFVLSEPSLAKLRFVHLLLRSPRA